MPRRIQLLECKAAMHAIRFTRRGSARVLRRKPRAFDYNKLVPLVYIPALSLRAPFCRNLAASSACMIAAGPFDVSRAEARFCIDTGQHPADDLSTAVFFKRSALEGPGAVADAGFDLWRRGAGCSGACGLRHGKGHDNVTVISIVLDKDKLQKTCCCRPIVGGECMITILPAPQ